MLTSLEIENFKGVAARQRIDFAPLTLLFGANSAGKSTILQALLYLHELLERGSADVDRTELGGSVLELGGFARLVHRHETWRAITLRAEFATPGRLERFGRGLSEFPFPDLDDEVESAWLELTIRHRSTPTFRGPLVERAVFGVNGDTEPIVWLELGNSLREGEPLYARVNLGHPLLATEARELIGFVTTEEDCVEERAVVRHAPAEITAAWEQVALPEDLVRRALEEDVGGSGGGTGLGAGLADGSGFGDCRSLPVFALTRGRLSALPHSAEALRVIVFGEGSPEKASAAAQIRAFLEMILLGTTAQLVSLLRDAAYIGPLRTIPPRGFLYERPGRIASWGDGLAAWDLLLADRLMLVEQTNAWLRRLGTAIQVVVQQLFEAYADADEISEDHVDETVRRLLLDTGAGSYVLPSEVGAGVSQIIPIIVAALDRRSRLTLVEQPEIHVHPAVQVGLGDLFIEATTREGARRLALVETHSEHLLLRIMRRMRETSEGRLPDGAHAVHDKDVSIVLVEKDESRSIFRRMPLNARGELVKAWPGGFFEEGLKEVL